jgi:Mg2+/Co2+ transporter CorB
MVPRNEVVGIDLDADWESIREQLNHLNHTRIPVYREKIDHIVGILHVKRVLRLFAEHEFDKESLESNLVSPYFVPEGTTLAKQLLNFQKRKRRMALVVDEYGDLLGLITLEDILEEIVGQFTTDSSTSKDIHPQPDGSILADASVHIRDLNRALHYSFPTDGPKTLNGMILEYLEMIPEPGTSLLLHGMPVEIIKTRNNAVKTVRLYPEKKPADAIKEGA